MGLKSPEAPAYMTRSVRVSSWLTTGASSPSFTSSKNSFSSATAGSPGFRSGRILRSLTRVSTFAKALQGGSGEGERVHPGQQRQGRRAEVRLELRRSERLELEVGLARARAEEDRRTDRDR